MIPIAPAGILLSTFSVPRRTARRRPRRKDRACRVDERVRPSRPPLPPAMEGRRQSIGRAAARVVECESPRQTETGNRFGSGAISSTRRIGVPETSVRPREIMSARRQNGIAHRAGFAADIICCGAQRPGWRAEAGATRAERPIAQAGRRGRSSSRPAYGDSSPKTVGTSSDTVGWIATTRL